MVLLGCLYFWVHVDKFGERGVPLRIDPPLTAFEQPFDWLGDERSFDPVKVGEHSIDPETYRICRLLCLSNADIKIYSLGEIWGEKSFFSKGQLGIWYRTFPN